MISNRNKIKKEVKVIINSNGGTIKSVHSSIENIDIKVYDFDVADSFDSTSIKSSIEKEYNSKISNLKKVW